MKRPFLIIVLLLVASFSLATLLQPHQPSHMFGNNGPGNALAVLLGDSRKMFARQMYAKADAYFHRGFYPSIFDQNQHHEENHMASAAQGGDHDDDDDAPPPAHDWIEAFGQHFYPHVHVHLKEGEEKEMLPWLRISADLDPHNVDTYAVTAYWLRDRLNRVDDAEEFLRTGLRANPGSPDLLYELGRLFFENKKDYDRARNVWKYAVRRWNEVEANQPVPDKLLLGRLLGGLSRVEFDTGHYEAAIGYLKQLKEISPNPEPIQKQIDALSKKITPTP